MSRQPVRADPLRRERNRISGADVPPIAIWFRITNTANRRTNSATLYTLNGV